MEKNVNSHSDNPASFAPIDILLVEDNPGDIDLTRIAFKKARVLNKLHVVEDGEAAINFLFQQPPYESEPRPDIILLDINLPKLNGIEVLEKIKTDPKTRSIPVIMLTSSEADKDISDSYSHYANSYIAKPVKVDPFFNIIQQLENFWLTVVKLPPNSD